jgi:hypothetical protein
MYILYVLNRARGSVVGSDTILQAGRSAGSIPNKLIEIISSPNPSSRIMDLWSTQPLTEMNARNIPGGKGRSQLKADGLTAICEPIV